MTHLHLDHGHDHGPADDRGGDRRRLAVVLALVVLFMAAEVLGGLLTGSLALLADAGHMFSDAGSLALALVALRLAGRPHTATRTYGYHRAEILAALANGVTLVAIALLIVIEAWERFREPREIAGGAMLAVATLGLGVNLVGLAVLHRRRSGSLNLRGAWLHVMSDTLGSLQAILAGALVWAFGWTWADPLASALIAVLVAASSWNLLSASVNVLLEAAPPHVDTAQVARAVLEVPGVQQVHDLHVWTITSGFDALSAHVRVGDCDRDRVLAQVQAVLRDRFGLTHTTLQVESGEPLAEGACPDPADCPPGTARAGRSRS
jgi:cobalt-zinc-cadmium efflux system protein